MMRWMEALVERAGSSPSPTAPPAWSARAQHPQEPIAEPATPEPESLASRGLNLLLASYRFKKPVLEVTWATLPMLGILAIGVLLITYVPWLTLGLLRLFGRL